MSRKLIFLDVETTGTNEVCEIHQLAAVMEINGNIVDEINLEFRPTTNAHYPAQVHDFWRKNPDLGLSQEIIEARDCPSNTAFILFMNWLTNHIDKFDKFDKATFVGFNAHFDESFVRRWMAMHDKSRFSIYGSYFWSGRIDILSDVCKVMAGHRGKLQKVNLSASFYFFDIDFDGQAHDALADIKATRELFYKLNPDGQYLQDNSFTNKLKNS